jgi:hypothetical protein
LPERSTPQTDRRFSWLRFYVRRSRNGVRQ